MPQQPQAEFSRLVDLITATVTPSSWRSVGGQGAITTVPASLSLIVEQTASVHQEIADLLAQLRKLQDIQVCVETRILGLLQRTFERIRADLRSDEGPATDTAASFPAQGSRLSTARAANLLKDCQGDAWVDVLQLPKITRFNSQSGEIRWQDRGENLVVHYRGVVPADGKSVQLTVELGETRAGVPQQVNSALLPDGGALLLDATADLKGWAAAQARPEDAGLLNFSAPYPACSLASAARSTASCRWSRRAWCLLRRKKPSTAGTSAGSSRKGRTSCRS